MYWIFILIFILAVLTPDLIREDFAFLSEARIEELIIFSLGLMGFSIFAFKEHQLGEQREEKEKSQRRLTQTAKDLVESYSYIGEINRKMDLIMQIGLGLSDQEELNKKKEKEIYQAILNAALPLVKATNSCLRFMDVRENKTLKEISLGENCSTMKNSDLASMGENVNLKKEGELLVVSSPKVTHNVRSFFIIEGAASEEVENQNNQEILKFLASQALFLFAYGQKTKAAKH